MPFIAEGWHTYIKPEWKYKYELEGEKIAKKCGLTLMELDKIISVLREYKIIED